jgi:hypothetical protein
MGKTLAIVLACAFVLFADDNGKPDLSGTWKASTDSRLRELTITPSGDALHVTESRNDGNSEWTCGTSGQQCDLQGGRKGTVSAWYNGPTLVVMETRGSNVSKERVQLSSDKSAMTVELIPVAPPGKTEKVELRKQ